MVNYVVISKNENETVVFGIYKKQNQAQSVVDTLKKLNENLRIEIIKHQMNLKPKNNNIVNTNNDENNSDDEDEGDNDENNSDDENHDDDDEDEDDEDEDHYEHENDYDEYSDDDENDEDESNELDGNYSNLDDDNNYGNESENNSGRDNRNKSKNIGIIGREIRDSRINDLNERSIRLGELGEYEMYKMEGNLIYTKKFVFTERYANEVWKDDPDVIFITGFRIAGNPKVLRQIKLMSEKIRNQQGNMDTYYNTVESYGIFIKKSDMNFRGIRDFGVMRKNNGKFCLEIVETSLRDYFREFSLKPGCREFIPASPITITPTITPTITNSPPNDGHITKTSTVDDKGKGKSKSKRKSISINIKFQIKL